MPRNYRDWTDQKIINAVKLGLPKKIRLEKINSENVYNFHLFFKTPYKENPDIELLTDRGNLKISESVVLYYDDIKERVDRRFPLDFELNKLIIANEIFVSLKKELLDPRGLINRFRRSSASWRFTISPIGDKEPPNFWR